MRGNYFIYLDFVANNTLVGVCDRVWLEDVKYFFELYPYATSIVVYDYVKKITVRNFLKRDIENKVLDSYRNRLA